MEGGAWGTEELINGPAPGSVRNTSEGNQRTVRSCPDHHHEAPEVALRAVVWVYMEQAVLTVILCWGAES